MVTERVIFVSNQGGVSEIVTDTPLSFFSRGLSHLTRRRNRQLYHAGPLDSVASQPSEVN